MPFWTDPALARLAEQMGGGSHPMFETAVLDELLRWSSWQAEPPSLHFFRTHAGREVDFVLHARAGVLAIEVKSSQRAYRIDARPLTEVLRTLAVRGVTRNAPRLGLGVTRGREIEAFPPNVWAILDWRLFGPAARV